jgi:hypothetical protein
MMSPRSTGCDVTQYTLLTGPLDVTSLLKHWWWRHDYYPSGATCILKRRNSLLEVRTTTDIRDFHQNSTRFPPEFHW